MLAESSMGVSKAATLKLKYTAYIVGNLYRPEVEFDCYFQKYFQDLLSEKNRGHLCLKLTNLSPNYQERYCYTNVKATILSIANLIFFLKIVPFLIFGRIFCRIYGGSRCIDMVLNYDGQQAILLCILFPVYLNVTGSNSLVHSWNQCTTWSLNNSKIFNHWRWTWSIEKKLSKNLCSPTGITINLYARPMPYSKEKKNSNWSNFKDKDGRICTLYGLTACIVL